MNTAAQTKKTPKKRADKYEEKLVVKGSFSDLIKASVSNKKDKAS